MQTKRVKRVKLLKGEKFIVFLGILFGFVVLPVSFVYTKAILSDTNYDLEKIKYKIDKQENANEALNMQIDELASIESIQSIASNNGLSYNNNNIKTISE